LDGNGNANKPQALVRPAVAPKLTVSPVVTPRSEEFNDDFNSNSADIALPEFSHAPKELLAGDANGNLNANEPSLIVRPAVAPKLTLAPDVTPRDLEEVLNEDLNGNGNANVPKVLLRPAVAPKLELKPVVAPRAEELSDKLSNNNAKIAIDNEKLGFAELPFAEHEPRALKEILSGDLNANGNANKPQLLVRPAVVPAIAVKPVVVPRGEELHDMEEEMATPELGFAHQGPPFPIDIKHGTLTGDGNGNLNANEPKLLLRPAVAPKLAAEPAIHI
jgi:hypothetical protein